MGADKERLPLPLWKQRRRLLNMWQ